MNGHCGEETSMLQLYLRENLVRGVDKSRSERDYKSGVSGGAGRWRPKNISGRGGNCGRNFPQIVECGCVIPETRSNMGRDRLFMGRIVRG